MNKPEVVWRVQNHERMVAWDIHMRLIRSLPVTDTFVFSTSDSRLSYKDEASIILLGGGRETSLTFSHVPSSLGPENVDISSESQFPDRFHSSQLGLIFEAGEPLSKWPATTLGYRPVPINLFFPGRLFLPSVLLAQDVLSDASSLWDWNW